MKKILPLLILLMTAGSLSGGTFHGQWIVRDASSNAVKFSSFTIQPISTYGTSTSNTITGDRKTFRTDSDGRVTVSNLFNGRSYRVQITGPNFTTTFTNSFDTNVTGLVNGADYISAPIRDAGLVAYSQTQADARFLRTNISHLVRPGDNITITTNGTGPSQYLTISSTASGGGSATNVNFYPGQSTTWRTLGGSNVVDVTGTLTNSTTGNAATATLATNAINATNLFGTVHLPMNLGESIQVTGSVADEVVTFNGEGGRIPLQIRWLDTAVGGSGIYSDEYNGNGIGLTNIPGASITGSLTNNTTGTASFVNGTLTNNTSGNASTATTATNALEVWRSYGNLWHNTNDFISESRVASASLIPIKWWGTWNDHAGYPTLITNVSETNILLQCHWMKTNGLWDAGYRYINVEEGWNAGLDANGDFIITNRFPNGMKWLFAEIRKLGFKPGIYTGINADEPATTCMGYAGTSYTNLINHMRTFADWGAEFLFFDSCNGYSKWTQAPAGITTAESWDEVGLFRERGRIIQWAIDQAGFTNPPVVLLSAPFVGSTNTLGSLFPDITATHQANTWPISPQTGWLDFASGSFYEVSQYYLNYSMQGARLTAPGFYQKGLTLSAQLGYEAMQLAGAFNAMLPSASSFESGGNRIAFWVDPVTYPMSSWDSYFQVHDPRKSVLVNMVQQDPAVIPGRVVYTNDSLVVITRPLGSQTGATNAVLVVNWKSTSQTLQMQHMLIGVRDSIPMTYREIYTNQIVANGVTSNVALTIGSSNVLFMLAYPDDLEPNETLMVSLKSDDMTGTGVGDISATSYGPANWYSRDGMSQSAANNQANIYFPIPTWASGVEVTAWMATAAVITVAWTNSPAYEMYRAGSREVFYDANTSGITNNIVLVSPGELTEYKTGFALTPTNYPRMFNLGMGASTNALARYIIGPVKLKFYGKSQ